MEISQVLVEGANNHLADLKALESMKHALRQVFGSSLTISNALCRALLVLTYMAERCGLGVEMASDIMKPGCFQDASRTQ